MTGFQVKPVVALERDILQGIGQHYGARQLTRQDLIDVQFDSQTDVLPEQGVTSLEISEQDDQVIRLVNSVLKDAIESQASDAHFEPCQDGLLVRFRVDGLLHDCLTVPAAMRKEVISRLMKTAQEIKGSIHACQGICDASSRKDMSRPPSIPS